MDDDDDDGGGGGGRCYGRHAFCIFVKCVLYKQINSIIVVKRLLLSLSNKQQQYYRCEETVNRNKSNTDNTDRRPSYLSYLLCYVKHCQGDVDDGN